MKADQPIGIFDSGIGGLTVFSAIKRLLPNEDLVYLGDSARVPYGTKSPETVIRYSVQNTEFLKSKGVKVIVAACNTVSAVALPKLTEEFDDISIIGVVLPGAEAAIKSSKRRVIGVIGTQATISSEAYLRALKRLDKNVKVISQACPLFVPLVEEGWLDNEIAVKTAEYYLADIVGDGIDVLILGCTHYPLLKKTISKIVGPGLALVDSSEATAAALAALLEKKGLKRSSLSKSKDQIYVTDLPARFDSVARRFLGENLPPIKHITL